VQWLGWSQKKSNRNRIIITQRRLDVRGGKTLPLFNEARPIFICNGHNRKDKYSTREIEDIRDRITPVICSCSDDDKPTDIKNRKGNKL
jgi:hypothetical protein